jgi:ABC transporter
VSEGGYLDQGAGRARGPKVVLADGVDQGAMAHVGDKDDHLHDVGKGCPDVIKHGPQVGIADWQIPDPFNIFQNAPIHPDRARIGDGLNPLARMRGRTASKLSGGERKMLAIARVLMLRPQVIIFDEPTANLAPVLARGVLEDQVRALADTGAAVLLVEQRASEALGIGNWGYLLVAGLVSVSGPAADLLAREDIGELFLGRRLPSELVAEQGS